jgi:hypothetical protein
MSITEKEEVELLYALKKLPDFECFPIPVAWYEKYKLAPRGVVNPREFMESHYTMKKALEEKELEPLIINEPQKNGKLVEFPEPEVIPIEVRSRPFELKEGEAFPTKLVNDNDPIIDASVPAPLFQNYKSSSVPSAEEHTSQQAHAE